VYTDSVTMDTYCSLDRGPLVTCLTQQSPFGCSRARYNTRGENIHNTEDNAGDRTKDNTKDITEDDTKDITKDDNMPLMDVTRTCVDIDRSVGDRESHFCFRAAEINASGHYGAHRSSVLAASPTCRNGCRTSFFRNSLHWEEYFGRYQTAFNLDY
jgi:hypothetical protein